MAEDRGQVFAVRLQQMLDLHEMKKVDLAAHLNVTKTTVSRYCKGRIPGPDILDKIAKRFGVSVDWLLGRSGSKLETTGAPANWRQEVRLALEKANWSERKIRLALRVIEAAAQEQQEDEEGER